MGASCFTRSYLSIPLCVVTPCPVDLPTADQAYIDTQAGFRRLYLLVARSLNRRLTLQGPLERSIWYTVFVVLKIASLVVGPCNTIICLASDSPEIICWLFQSSEALRKIGYDKKASLPPGTCICLTQLPGAELRLTKCAPQLLMLLICPVSRSHFKQWQYLMNTIISLICCLAS